MHHEAELTRRAIVEKATKKRKASENSNEPTKKKLKENSEVASTQDYPSVAAVGERCTKHPLQKQTLLSRFFSKPSEIPE